MIDWRPCRICGFPVDARHNVHDHCMEEFLWEKAREIAAATGLPVERMRDALEEALADPVSARAWAEDERDMQRIKMEWEAYRDE